MSNSALEARQQKEYKLVLDRLLQEATNKVCADCASSAPRWASAKLGIFLCIQCAGTHRSMGTHISFVRSVNLDKWKEAEIQTMKQWGNARAALVYEAKLPRNFQRPAPSDGYNLEKFIRAKYISKQFYQAKTPEEIESQLATPTNNTAATTSNHLSPGSNGAEETSGGRLSGSAGRRPVRRPMSPASPTQSPPPLDFNKGWEASKPAAQAPSSASISKALNFLSLEDTNSGNEFEAYAPAVPAAKSNVGNGSLLGGNGSLLGNLGSGSNGAVGVSSIPVENNQTKINSILGLFEPQAPALGVGSVGGYPGYSAASAGLAGYGGGAAAYGYPYGVAAAGPAAGVASIGVAGYGGYPVAGAYGAAGAYYQQPVQQQAYSVPSAGGYGQQAGWGASGAAVGGYDPILSKIQNISQERTVVGAASGGVAAGGASVQSNHLGTLLL